MVRSLLAIALLSISAHSFAQGTARDPAPAASPAVPVVAGEVELTEGDVRFFDANRRMRRPKVGDPIHEGESITTGADGEVHLQMEDGGYIAVRPGTRMRIVNFRAQGDADDRSVIALLEGSFRAVTGWIAKAGARRAVVNTPTATIGIRGTEHEPLVIPEGSPRGEPGTYDRVHTGETEIRTKQGVVSVRPNQAGFAPHRGALRPRVLDRVPDFFRPTRNEARFSGLHGRVHKQLDQRRDERRRDIEQRRKLQTERRDDAGKGKAARDEKKRSQIEKRDKKERAEQEKKRREKGDQAERGNRKGEPDARQPERRQRGEDPQRKAEDRGRKREEQTRKADERKQERPESRNTEKQGSSKGDRKSDRRRE